MSYWDISEMSRNADLFARVEACASQENIEQPRQWTAENMLHIAASPGWDAAWASAVHGGVEQPGRDPGVITDGMVLSSVQAIAADDPGSA